MRGNQPEVRYLVPFSSFHRRFRVFFRFAACCRNKRFCEEQREVRKQNYLFITHVLNKQLFKRLCTSVGPSVGPSIFYSDGPSCLKTRKTHIYDAAVVIICVTNGLSDCRYSWILNSGDSLYFQRLQLNPRETRDGETILYRCMRLYKRYFLVLTIYRSVDRFWLKAFVRVRPEQKHEYCRSVMEYFK